MDLGYFPIRTHLNGQGPLVYNIQIVIRLNIIFVLRTKVKHLRDI